MVELIWTYLLFVIQFMTSHEYRDLNNQPAKHSLKDLQENDKNQNENNLKILKYIEIDMNNQKGERGKYKKL